MNIQFYPRKSSPINSKKITKIYENFTKKNDKKTPLLSVYVKEKSPRKTSVAVFFNRYF